MQRCKNVTKRPFLIFIQYTHDGPNNIYMIINEYAPQNKFKDELDSYINDSNNNMFF